jgi:hypothetical protein
MIVYPPTGFGARAEPIAKLAFFDAKRSPRRIAPA